MKTSIPKARSLSGAVKSTAIFIPRPNRTIEWFGGVTYANLHDVLGEMKLLLQEDRKEEIHLLVNSYGGATGIGMTFYDTVQTLLKPNLVTIGSGDVDSSGIIVLLAGKRRYLTPNTTLLLHLAGRTFAAEKRFSTADMATMLAEDKLKDYQYACVVANGTNGRYTPENILELMSRNTILTPQEAVNMGLVHKVIS
ncbi:MAG: ATP-dependent Clp protease proteolytic subunit [Patescibacteria group bacterium]